jgi:hypothetical protein
MNFGQATQLAIRQSPPLSRGSANSQTQSSKISPIGETWGRCEKEQTKADSIGEGTRAYESKDMKGAENEVFTIP